MKKILLIFTLFFSLTVASTYAETYEIHPPIKTKKNDGKDDGRGRAPIYLPIKIYLDTDNNTVRVVSNDDIQASVSIYNEAGELAGYSMSINAVLPILSSGNYSIYIDGDGWYAEAEFSI